MTRAYVELGHYAKSTAKDHAAEHDNERLQKATIAYSITPDAGNFWSRPEIRIYATYLHGNDNSMNYQGMKYDDVFVGEGKNKGKVVYTNCSGKQTSAFNAGVMFEAWW